MLRPRCRGSRQGFEPLSTLPSSPSESLRSSLSRFHCQTMNMCHGFAPFGLPHIRLVRLLFSARTVFFSHNISARIVFSANFSQNSASRTGPMGASMGNSLPATIPPNPRVTNSYSSFEGDSKCWKDGKLNLEHSNLSTQASPFQTTHTSNPPRIKH